jgi:multidrug efflux pump subunit AcrA (membrane-fusion protein)
MPAMQPSIRAMIATCGLALLWAFSPVGVGIGAEKGSAAGKGPLAEVQVKVVRAVQAWFAAEIRVTGFLVAREEAIVGLDVPGYKLSEVLVSEGDRVTSGQVLARLARQSAEGPDPNADRRPTTINLKAPAAGVNHSQHGRGGRYRVSDAERAAF